MEFRSYRLSDGFFNDPSLLYDRPLQPGRFLTKVPVISDMQLRTGTVVGMTVDPFLVGLGAGEEARVVHVVWNDWHAKTGIARGELRLLMGIVNDSKQRKRTKWEAKKRARTQGDPSPTS